jgi:hypothetical protein
MLPFASRAFNSEHQFLSGFGLLSQNRLGLATKALLFPVIPETNESSLSDEQNLF